MAARLSRGDRVAVTFSKTGVSALLRRVGTWDGLLVLNYHRVGEPLESPLDRGLFSATEEQLEQEMALLAANYDVVSIDDVAAVLRRPRGRHVLVTFDDGYRDNHDAALPVLRRAGIPAAFFIATGFIDRPRLPWWDEIAYLLRNSPHADLPPGPCFSGGIELEPDREVAINLVLSAYKTADGDTADELLAYVRAVTDTPPDERREDLWMTWDMVRALRDAGMTIGAHTVDHPVLGRVPEERQRREIAGSLERLEEELGERPRAFSYPVGMPGSYDETTKRLLREHGVEMAFEFQGGLQRPIDIDPFALRRVSVAYTMPLARFQAMLVLPQRFGRW
ncbi:MAG TPA: polysaccharide deacetylase family protein [Solirubrobacteraceae bacterium]|nr:polysaccharide deacetylase family protein [Solirubrobacteraceae bacterium]